MIDGASVVTYELFPNCGMQINRGYVVSCGSRMSKALLQVPPSYSISFTLDHLIPICRMTQKTCHVLVMSLFVLCHFGADRDSWCCVSLCDEMCLVCSCAAV